MSRVLKFRAWDNGMYDNVLVDGDIWTADLRADLWHSGNVMQFTGLLDKNGKEIYEGDILKGWFYVSIGEPIKGSFAVVYNQSWAAFGVENECAFVTIGNSEYEIIGNIYENPELLNG